MAKRAKPAARQRRGARSSGEASEPAPSKPVKPPPEAVARYEEAMRAVQRHEYPKAAEAFRGLIAAFPRERALLDRSRVYLALCRREMASAPPPQTREERLTAATAALNEDDDARAEALAKGILSEDPKHDIALYLLAAVEARRGHVEAALAYLRQAVEISAEAGAQARLDEDFESLRDNEEFRQLTEQPDTLPGSGDSIKRS